MPRLALAIAFLLLPSLAGAAPCAGFIDVDDASGPTAPFCADVAWLKNRGITLGCTVNMYCPWDNVTRLQMAAFMHRLGKVTFQQHGNALGGPATLGTNDDHPLDIRVNSRRAMRYEPATSPNVIGGISSNYVASGTSGATIAGGGASGAAAGYENRVTSDHGSIGGGYGNDVFGFAGVIGGGLFNATGGYATTIAGGDHNAANGQWAAIGGGRNNTATGIYATVPGGAGNWAGADRSVAMGSGAVVLPGATGSFVYSDASAGDFTSGIPNEFLVAATNGIGLYTSKSYATYCRINPGGGSWNCSSSREVKREFAPVDPIATLERVVALPISTWRFVGQPDGTRHMGPMAEDFRAAFGLGSDERSIASVDAQGVAFAAIQGLDAKLARQAERIAQLEARLAVLEAQGRLDPASASASFVSR